MQNKRGEGYIPTCVMIIILTMLLSVFVTFVSAINIVKQTKRNSRVVLDSYVDSLCEFCIFAEKNDMLYNYNSDGDIQFYLTKPTVGYMEDKELKIYTSYTIYIPICFAGIRVETAQIPITVTSNFTQKF